MRKQPPREPDGTPWTRDQIIQYYNGRTNDTLDWIIPIWDRFGSTTYIRRVADLIRESTYNTNIDMILATKVLERYTLDNNGYVRYILPIVPENNEERYVRIAALQPLYNTFAYIRSTARYFYMSPISGIVRRIADFGDGEMSIFMNARPFNVKTDQTRLTDWYGSRIRSINTARNRARTVERNGQRSAAERQQLWNQELQRRQDEDNGIV